MNRKRFTAFVVFYGSENRRAWRFFTKRGWRHVSLIIPAYDPYPSLTAKECAQVLEFTTDHCKADVVFKPARVVARQAIEDGATCAIAFSVDQKFTGRYRARGLFTCVSMTKSFLSIGAWYVWTPAHLARWLLRNGGELITKPETTRNDIPFQQAESRQESAASG